MQQTPIRSFLCALALAAGIVPAAQADNAPLPATMRLDYQHSGNALSEHYAVERVLVEPRHGRATWRVPSTTATAQQPAGSG